MQSAAMGALPTMRAAVDSGVEGGDYYGPGGLMQMKGNPVKVKSSKASHNSDNQRKLWQVSQELTGVSEPPRVYRRVFYLSPADTAGVSLVR